MVLGSSRDACLCCKAEWCTTLCSGVAPAPMLVKRVSALWSSAAHSWSYTTTHYPCRCMRLYVPWATALARWRMIAPTCLRRLWTLAQGQEQSAGHGAGQTVLRRASLPKTVSLGKYTCRFTTQLSQTYSWKKSHSPSCLPAMLSATSFPGMYIKPVIIQCRTLDWHKTHCFFCGCFLLAEPSDLTGCGSKEH